MWAVAHEISSSCFYMLFYYVLFSLAVQKLRKSLLSFEFEINDKFCDAGELKEAWENKSMPDEFLTFFC